MACTQTRYMPSLSINPCAEARREAVGAWPDNRGTCTIKRVALHTAKGIAAKNSSASQQLCSHEAGAPRNRRKEGNLETEYGRQVLFYR